MPLLSLIIQAALFALFAILIVLLIVFSALLSSKTRGRKKTGSLDETADTVVAEENIADEEIVLDPKERPIWEKYPQIYRFEMLYWRGVSKPWWWNNYAYDLVDYANEYFPWNKVNYYSSYNSNSKSEDFSDPEFHDRIVALRPHKRSKHPLVVINYNEEYIMIDSSVALEEMKDRIDAEWLRYYRFKKTYRNSPTTYTP
jgi:hypothetical protein